VKRPAAGPVLEVLVSTRPGGGPRHVLDLCLGLRARGWQPLVAAPRDGAFFDRFVEAGIEIVQTPTDRIASGAAILRARGVRLLHSHGKGAGLHARLAARALAVPAVHTFHGIHVERYGRLKRAAYVGLERGLSRWTAGAIHVSHAQAAEARELALVPAARSHVVVNGIDIARVQGEALEAADARYRLGLEPGPPVVGAVARLDQVKRLDLLVQAAARVARPDLVVVLVGAGPEEPRLRELVRALGVQDRVRLAGEVPDAATLLRAFNVYAAPSRKEGMPLAVVEAMALGLPVVASDIPAHREVLGPGSAGIVAGCAELVRMLNQLLADASTRAALGADNRTRAERLFDARTMVDGIDAIYRGVLGLQ